MTTYVLEVQHVITYQIEVVAESLERAWRVGNGIDLDEWEELDLEVYQSDRIKESTVPG